MRYFVKNSLFQALIAFFIWFLIGYILFLNLQILFSQPILKSIQVQFREEFKNSNYQYIARIVSDLKNSKTVECPILKIKNSLGEFDEILNLNISPQCQHDENIKYFLKGIRVKSVLTSINGDEYSLELTIINSDIFRLTFFVFIVSGYLFIFLILLVYRYSRRIEYIEFEQEKKIMNIKNDVLRQVAHDIRAPLATLQIICDSQTAINKSDKDAILREITFRIQSIANDLLKQSKNNYNPLNLTIKETIILPQLLDSTLVEAKINLNKFYWINFSESIDKKTQVKIHFDQSKFQRIIINLITNAIDSIPTTSKGEILISFRKYEDKIAISISDNGIGINENILKDVFNKNYTTKSNGNGLGLSNAKEVINFYNGNIEIVSKENIGTIVNIYLPVLEIF